MFILLIVDGEIQWQWEFPHPSPLLHKKGFPSWITNGPACGDLNIGVITELEFVIGEIKLLHIINRLHKDRFQSSLIRRLTLIRYALKQEKQREKGSAFLVSLSLLFCKHWPESPASIVKAIFCIGSGSVWDYWPGGAALIGEIVNKTATTVTRVMLKGTKPGNKTKVGMNWIYGADPKVAYGFDFYEDSVTTDLGAAPMNL